MAGGLQMTGIRHRFGDRVVLDDAGLTAAPGELVCLLGPSGCGKTTLLRLAAGLEDLQEGRITLGGEEVATPGRSLPPERRGVGLMFQDYALFPHLTVLGNVMFGLRHWKRDAARDRAFALLGRLGMAEYAESYPHTLSGGQQQRVALARALAPEPRALLLDEPFSGLDVTLRAQVREEMLEILKETGVAAVMVTHDPEEAMFMADRIKVMGDGGRVVQKGTPAEVYFSPADPFVARLFGPVNRFRAAVSQGVAATPLGPVPAGDLAEGTPVQVMIRHEALRLGPAGGVAVEVAAVHLLRGTSHVHLRLDGDDTEYEALVPIGMTPTEGDRLRLTVDPSMAFVFPEGQAPHQ